MSVVFRTVVGSIDRVVPSKLRPMWEHPTGPQTIFFWAPMMKWGLVVAGLADIARPVDKISIEQTASIAATGVVWSRWSMVITPKQWPLFSVNFFVAITNIGQLGRIAYVRNKTQDEASNNTETVAASTELESN